MFDEENKYKETIGYKPSIEYTDEYNSELDYQNLFNENKDNDSNTDKDLGKEEIEDLIEDMKDLGGIIDKLPGGVSDIIDEVYDQILDFVDDELTDKEVVYVPEEDEWTYDDNNWDDDKTQDEEKEPLPDFDKIWDMDDFFPMNKEEHTEAEIIEKEYIKNLVDLLTDYKTNLHNIISNFWTNFFLSTYNKNQNEIKMLLDNIVLSSSDVQLNAKHLLDSAVRQEIIKTIKLDYFNMMFNAEETIKQLKQLKAMKELRLRYSQIEEVEGDTKIKQLNNNVLIASKLTYDRNYDIAYENLYRYLSSSNKVLNDTLQTWIQEIKSKQILIERNGIK